MELAMKFRVVAIVCVLALPACSVWTDLFRPSPPNQFSAETARAAARVIPMTECPVYKRSLSAGATAVLPIVAAAVPFLIVLGQQAITAEVAKAQSDLSTSWVATGTRPPEGEIGCFVIARGKFGKDSADPAGELIDTDIDAIGASELPSLYVEIAVSRVAEDGTRTFEPVFYQYSDTAAKNPGDGQKTVGILLGFSRAPITAVAPTPDQVQKADIVVPFALGRLRWGTSLKGNGTGRVRDPFADQIRSVPTKVTGGDMLSPTKVSTRPVFNAYAIVSESDDPAFFDGVIQKAIADKTFSDLLQGVAKIFTSSPANAK
jgi:hypothetical protein